MKVLLFLFLWLTSLSICSQVLIKGPWKIVCGASSNNAFQRSSSLNLRFVSPRFKWSDDWTAEEEKNPEKYKNMRLMLELIYTPPLKVLCSGFNAQYRLIKYKRVSMEIYGGLKFFFATGPDFTVPNTRVGHTADLWYMNLGLLFQLNLGIISPFADIGGDYIVTIGAEFNFHSIYRKTRNRYNLRTKKINE
jgi:hypothetical protein